MKLLSEEEKKAALSKLNSWKPIIVNNAEHIQRDYTFQDFNECFSYMTRIALQSEKLNHHPRWINVYNSLTIQWSSHECNGISENDIIMATFCDNIYQNK
jgi:4a-hydroxytetrahydrobiopterin dehydratase